MNKFKVLLDFERGDITLTQAASLLQAKHAADVIRSLAAYRGNLPYLIKMADKLSHQHPTQSDRRKIVEQIAEKFEITPRQVNRMMKNTAVVTPSPYRVVLRSMRKDEAQKKWEARLKGALSMISGADSMESAAEYAEVTTRQMYRWVNKVLEPKFVTVRDLKSMSLTERRMLSESIAEEIAVDDEEIDTVEVVLKPEKVKK